MMDTLFPKPFATSARLIAPTLPSIISEGAIIWQPSRDKKFVYKKLYEGNNY